jgi:hypothetical protein
MRTDLTSLGPDAGSADSRRVLGRRGEGLAAVHLERLGYAILARNVRTRYGEIDLIAFDGRTLAMIEVKTRRVGAHAQHLSPGQQPSGLACAGLPPRGWQTRSTFAPRPARSASTRSEW